MNLQSFLYFQPNYPVKSATDDYYLGVAEEIERTWRESGLLEVHPIAAMLVSIHLTGYFQDIVYDAGLWRTFTACCLRTYGQPVPLVNISGNDYIPAELNRADVHFMLWYLVAFTSPDHHLLSPDNRDVQKLAELIHAILEKHYEEAPRPDNYEYFFRIDLEENPPAHQIYDLTQWLFWRSWLISPVFMYYNNSAALEIEKLDREGTPESRKKAEQLRTESMTSAVTGPLALKIGEWVRLLLTNNDILPGSSAQSDADAQQHKYYAGYMRVSGGEPLMFIPTYAALNEFVIDALGWEKGVNHLEGLREADNFVLKIDRTKGLLIAPCISPCVASPRNPTYDRQFACEHAMELLTIKGVCPPDLRKYLLAENMLPDAVFPGSSNHDLVSRNADFISRCYLQEYYDE